MKYNAMRVTKNGGWERKEKGHLEEPELNQDYWGGNV